jgi:dihydrofolate reductase
MSNPVNNLTGPSSSNQGFEGKGTSIAMVVAASTNNAIGKNNQLLWNLPNDMRFFKNITWGFPVIMVRKTFEVFDKPLAGRTNIVITRKEGWQPGGAIVAKDIQDAIKKGETTNARQLFIIGGGEIYKQSMNVADTIYITRVHAVLEGDAYFPVIEQAQWMLDSNEDFPADEKHAFAYSFQVWKKR